MGMCIVAIVIIATDIAVVVAGCSCCGGRRVWSVKAWAKWGFDCCSSRRGDVYG